MNHKKSLALFFCSVMLVTNTVCTPIAVALHRTRAVVDGKEQEVLLISGDIARPRWQRWLFESAAWKWVAVKRENSSSPQRTEPASPTKTTGNLISSSKLFGPALSDEGELGLTPCDVADPQRIQAGDADVGSDEWLKAANAAKNNGPIQQVEEIVSDWNSEVIEEKKASVAIKDEKEETKEEDEDDEDDEESEDVPEMRRMPTAEEERRAAANAAAACFCPVAEWAVNAVHSVPRVVSPPYEAVAKNSDEILDKLQAAMQGMDLSLARIDQFLKANSSFVGTNAQARASAEDLKVNHGRARAELKRALADGLRITDAQDDTAAVCVSYANDLRRAASRWKKVSKALWGPAIRASWFALISALGGVFQLEVESETSYAADELARAGLAGGLAAPTGPNWSGATQPLPLGPFHLQEEPRPASEVRPENVVEREKQLPPGFRWHTGTAETPTLRIVPLPSTAVLPSHYILKAVCSAGGDITIFPAHGTPGSICEIPVDVAQQKPVTIVIKRHLGYNLEAIRVDKQYFPSVFLGITTGNAVTFNFPLPGEGPITHDTDIEVEFATQASAHTWQHNTVSNIVPSG